MCFDGRKPAAESLMRAIGKAKDGAGGRCSRCGSTNTHDKESLPPIRCCRDCGFEARVGASGDEAPREARGTIPETCPACGSREIRFDPDDRTRWECAGCRLYWCVAQPLPPSVGPSPATIEDRGTPAWAWRDAAGWLSFWRMPGAVERCEVSVPIGWRLRPDPEMGVVLANVYGDRLTAAAALFHAERGEGGFRLRGKMPINAGDSA